MARTSAAYYRLPHIVTDRIKTGAVFFRACNIHNCVRMFNQRLAAAARFKISITISEALFSEATGRNS